MKEQSTQSPSSPETVRAFIARHQEARGLTDEQLAHAIGYARGAVVRLITTGDMRVPINKVVALADALAVERAELFELVMQESSPGLVEVIRGVYPSAAITPIETRVLNQLRALSGSRPGAPMVFDGAGVIALISVP